MRGADPVQKPECWPRMVQVAWLLCEEDGTIADEQSHIVYPDGYTIPPEVSRIHGITTEIAKKKGQPLPEVLSWFSEAVRRSELLVGHNVEFDRNVLAAEYVRSGQKIHIHSCPYFCTMKSTIDYCKIPYPSGRKGNKWPKLMELHTMLFDCGFSDAHDALADVRACARCFFELKQRDALTSLHVIKEIRQSQKKPKKSI